MKKIQVLFASVLVLAIAGTLVAFSGIKESKRLTIVFREYTLATNPPTLSSQVSDINSYGAELGNRPSTVTPGSKWYYIEYDKDVTSFAQARSILATEFSNGTTFQDGVTYDDGSGHEVTLFLKQ
jgi:hypothetical protein